MIANGCVTVTTAEKKQDPADYYTALQLGALCPCYMSALTCLNDQ